MFTKSNSIPKYNTFQNIGFMIRLAWNSDEKMVLVLCLLIALLSVAQNLIDLYISPVILDAVENHVPVIRLLPGYSWCIHLTFPAVLKSGCLPGLGRRWWLLYGLEG